MATNVKIKKKDRENNLNFLRRFSRKMRATGISQSLRKRRYFERQPSDLNKKRSALVRIERGVRYEKLRKLGKIG